MPNRVHVPRRGGRVPHGAVMVGRPGSRFATPFRYRTRRALARVPAALGDGGWEYEGRVSAHGARHDYWHPGGKITVCHVRYMSRAECVETFRQVLTGNLTPALIASGIRADTLGYTAADVRRELAGKDLACYCPIYEPCHADVLLGIANA